MGLFSTIDRLTINPQKAENEVPLPTRGQEVHQSLPPAAPTQEEKRDPVAASADPDREKEPGHNSRTRILPDSPGRPLLPADSSTPPAPATSSIRNLRRIARGGVTENFRAAWPWIRENLDTLLAHGWTRPALFQRGKQQYPCGDSGVAWADAWKKPELSLSVGAFGEIRFTFGHGDRKVTQSAHVPPLKRHTQPETERKT